MTPAPRSMIRVTRVLIGSVVFLGACATAAALWLPAANAGGTLFDRCGKVWSHRTLTAGASSATENTADGVRAAFRLGAGGVEIDVVYDPASGGLFAQSGEAAEAGLPADVPLESLLRAVPGDGCVWLDFWTLARVPDEAVPSAVTRLAEILRATGSTDRAFVESTSVERLRRVAEEGLATSLWIDPRAVHLGRRAHVASVLRLAEAFRRGPFSAVSMDYEDYSPIVRAAFRRVPILLFTVNDPADVERFADDARVRVVLTDAIPVPGVSP